MAIEVIHRGVHPDEVKYRGRCYTCCTVVEFKKPDAKYTPGYDQRDGPTLSVTCPVCNGTITVAV